MPWGAVAAVGGAYLMSQGSQSAASTQAGATADAAQAQLQATRESIAAQQQALAQQTAQLQPYSQFGQQAMGTLQNLMTPGQNQLQTLQKLPGYQAGIQQGQQTLENSALSRGMGLSGQTAQALTKFGTDYANQQYGQYFNQLMQATGVGQASAAGQAAQIGQSAANIGNLTMQGGQNLANMYTNQGNIAAANQLGQAQIQSNLLGNLAYMYG